MSPGTKPFWNVGRTQQMTGAVGVVAGSALGFRNLTHYIARSLLESGGFRPTLHSQSR
ncbi:Mobile element protein [Brevibacterium aurantiacum]|uniref:Mobile element protein n=1 Tax=Brevibacterium aurantiacum TaxID=273384 RepID=A0A1D7W3A6_BREAU|nr:Mobile element protein [Brevibacterium aurantiacum]